MKTIKLISLLVMLVIAWGCNRNKSANGHNHAEGESHSDGHDHSEIEAMTHTFYTSDFELFAEIGPLIQGEEAEIFVHLTDLSTYKPIESAEITTSLIVGEKGIRKIVTQADKASHVFELTLQPVVSGKGKLIFEVTRNGKKESFAVDNIPVFADDHEALHAEQDHVHGENPIKFSKEQAWKSDFKVQQVKRSTFHQVLKTSGQIISAPGDEITLSATASGITKFVNNRIVDGLAVRAGEALFAISGKGLTEGNSETKSADAKLFLDNAKKNYDRATELVKDQIISQKEFNQRKLDYEQALINYQTLSADMGTSGKSIATPISGFIKNILVQSGQYVEIGQPIATITQNRRLLLSADIPQRFYSQLNNIATANFTTSYDNHTYDLSELNGKLLSIGKSTSTTTFTKAVNFEFDNKGDITPGVFVNVYLKSSPIPNAITIPETALTEEQGHFFVYVQTEGEIFQKREVIPGMSDGLNVQILSGLEENERIVTRGAYLVKLASLSNAVPHGHEH